MGNGITFGPYTKTIMQLVAAVAAAIAPALVDGPVGLSEIVNVAVLGLGAVHVFNAANIPGWNYAKGFASALAATGVVFISVYSGDGHVSISEWWQIASAFVLGVGGVVGFSNGARAVRGHVDPA